MIQGTFNPVSNYATWTEQVVLRVWDNGDPFDLEEEVDSIEVTVRDPFTGSVILRASTADDTVVVVNPGVFEFMFTAEQMGGLEAKTHEVGCLIEILGETVQVFLMRLPVWRGL